MTQLDAHILSFNSHHEFENLVIVEFNTLNIGVLGAVLKQRNNYNMCLPLCSIPNYL